MIQEKETNINYGEKDLKYRFIPKAMNNKCQSEFTFLCLDQVAVGGLKPPGLDRRFKNMFILWLISSFYMYVGWFYNMPSILTENTIYV